MMNPATIQTPGRRKCNPELKPAVKNREQDKETDYKLLKVEDWDMGMAMGQILSGNSAVK